MMDNNTSSTCVICILLTAAVQANGDSGRHYVAELSDWWGDNANDIFTQILVILCAVCI